jgi:hypothetical protein
MINDENCCKPMHNERPGQRHFLHISPVPIDPPFPSGGQEVKLALPAKPTAGVASAIILRVGTNRYLETEDDMAWDGVFLYTSIALGWGFVGAARDFAS